MSNGTAVTLSGNAFVVFNKGWGRDNANLLSLTAGVNVESAQSESHSFSALGVLSDKLEHPSMATGFAESSHPGGSEDRSRMLGCYVNANYIWGKPLFRRSLVPLRRLFEIRRRQQIRPCSVRWASAGTSTRSVSCGGTAVSLLKLRASIGYVGNAGFSPYQAQLAYQYSSDLLYNGSIGAVPVSMVNPRLKWERSLKRNFGVDFGFWNDRVNGSADIYYDTTNDLVMTIAKPDHIGFSNAKENLGKIRNSGVEPVAARQCFGAAVRT